MMQSGGRRIKRSIILDMNSIKFCDAPLLAEFSKVDLVHDFLSNKITAIQQYSQQSPTHFDSPLDGPQVTNAEVFRAYIESYLRKHPDIHQENLPFLIHSLEPSANGLPIEIYVFARTTVWEQYELIQAQIFDHLIAAANYFDLRLFQQPTGTDFNNLVTKRVSVAA
jgi:miniconductance mechanosensitive channel